MNIATGTAAELHAARHLEQQGLKLLDRQIRCRWGEIDLLMADGDCWVFVEVKARRSQAFGGGLAAITTQKQRKLRRTAEWILNNKRRSQQPCRFDVVEVNLADQTIDWIRNAF